MNSSTYVSPKLVSDVHPVFVEDGPEDRVPGILAFVVVAVIGVTAVNISRWFRRYWPWLIALFWLGGYEIVALVNPNVTTLSGLVWSARANFEGLVWLVTIPVLVLLWHFFWQSRR